MNEERTMLLWIENKTGYKLKSIKETMNGVALAQYLCNFAKLPKTQDSITDGSTAVKRTKNFKLIKKLIQSLDLEFNFDIENLSQGNVQELKSLIQYLIALDEGDEEELDEIHKDDANENRKIEILLSQLDDSLAAKLEKIQEMNEQMKVYGEERDFYLDKLLRIEDVCKKYPQAIAEPALKILQLRSNDFNVKK